MSEDADRIVDAAALAIMGASRFCFNYEPLAAMNKCETTKAWQPCVCYRQARAALAAAVREAGLDADWMHHAASTLDELQAIVIGEEGLLPTQREKLMAATTLLRALAGVCDE